MVDVTEVLEVLDAEMVPFHEEYSAHQPVGNWFASVLYTFIER